VTRGCVSNQSKPDQANQLQGVYDKPFLDRKTSFGNDILPALRRPGAPTTSPRARRRPRPSPPAARPRPTRTSSRATRPARRRSSPTRRSRTPAPVRRRRRRRRHKPRPSPRGGPANTLPLCQLIATAHTPLTNPRLRVCAPPPPAPPRGALTTVACLRVGPRALSHLLRTVRCSAPRPTR
jgi:hypothetical protein